MASMVKDLMSGQVGKAMRMNDGWTLFCLALVVATLGCASSAPVPEAKPKATAIAANPAPCWIDKPQCQKTTEDSAFYFVGQSKEPLAHPGRPSRNSVHAARRDAEVAYARFLGVDIETSSTLKTVFSNESYWVQFQEDIQEDVDATVDSLVKVEQYNVADQYTEEGMPLWNVYVLVKVAQESVVRHRAAIAEERKLAESAPPPPDEWVASVYNIDDSVSVYVNGTKVNQCDFSRSCEIRLTPHFRPGINKVKLVYQNDVGFWAYGYEILKNDEVMYKGRCGQVWVYGCGFLDTTLGVVHEFEFKVDWEG